MSEPLQYITNQDGERVGVLLDLQTYQQLTQSPVDDEILTDLSLEELQALSESTLSPKTQVELNDLLTRNVDNTLSDDDKSNLERLLAQVDQLNILKTRARYTLQVKGITKVA